MNQEFIDKVVRDNCYSFLKNPVIVTSGNDMTPFFLNGENLMENGNDIEVSGHDYKSYQIKPRGMALYVKERLRNSQLFRDSVKYATEMMKNESFDVISGGRTRDWPFAIAIARELNLPFLALYKEIDKEYNPLLINPSSLDILDIKEISGAKVGHTVDLVTTASSVTKDTWGWIPQVRTLEGNITDVYAFIDRNQGAKENIRALGVNLHSFCSITPEWLEKYDAEHLEIVQAYLENPINWTMQYLHQNGLKALNQYLDGSWNKDDRFLKFMTINQKRLGQEGLWEKIIDYSNSLGTYKTHDGRYDGNLIGAISDFLK